MSTTMTNLFNKEEILELNLQNIGYELNIYLKQLAQFLQLETFQDQREKAEWFQTLFKYYAEDLIPALEESAAMEEKHLSLMDRNPDFMFQPIKMKIDCHQHIINTFIERFQNSHEAYYTFISKARFNLDDND